MEKSKQYQRMTEAHPTRRKTHTPRRPELASVQFVRHTTSNFTISPFDTGRGRIIHPPPFPFPPHFLGRSPWRARRFLILAEMQLAWAVSPNLERRNP